MTRYVHPCDLCMLLRDLTDLRSIGDGRVACKDRHQELWAASTGSTPEPERCICVRGSDGPDESCPVHGRREDVNR